MKAMFGMAIIAALGAAFFLFLAPKRVEISPPAGLAVDGAAGAAFNLPAPPESAASALPRSTSSATAAKTNDSADVPPQQPLQSPPAVVKGVYLTGWSAGYAPKVNSIIGLAGRTEINAVVIDIKDFSGSVSYKGIAEAAAIGAENQIKIAQPNALIKKLHGAGIYVMGRITVFQDPILAKAHPEWALKNKATGGVWTDNKGLAWMDAAAEPVWEYNAAIAKDALARGFDEVNFDYVRFASDGNLANIGYPFWDQKTARHKIIGNLFKFLRETLGNARLSADLFGLSTVNADDLGIGQVIEDAYKYFDYVSPMVYPSHYAAGFIGYQNPAKYPYEVIKYSMDKAVERLKNYELGIMNNASMAVSSTTENPIIHSSKLRPWLQDFDFGATYDAPMVKKEIQAVYDSFSAIQSASSTANVSGTPITNYQLPITSSQFGGWLLWDPANIYTEGALSPKITNF